MTSIDLLKTFSQTLCNTIIPLRFGSNMKPSISKPKVFVGSSAESIEIAHAVQENLDHDAIVTVWDQGVFGLSKQTLESLEEQLDLHDFAIFVLGPDDKVELRGAKHSQTRDNVILELGLFMGKLGRNRAYWLTPRDIPDFVSPTDLVGLTAAQYNVPEQNEWVQAVAVACNKIRREIKSLGKRNAKLPNVFPAGFVLHEKGRVSVEDTVRLMDTARSDVTVVGSTLRSWVGYFDRIPAANFKHPVHRLAEKGVNFRFYFLDPDSDSAKTYANDCRDEAIEEIRESIEKLRELVSDFNGIAGSMEVFVYSRFPFGYALLIDSDALDAKTLVSPYLPGLTRADCPYIEIHRSLSPNLYSSYHKAIENITDPSNCQRLFGSVRTRRRSRSK